MTHTGAGPAPTAPRRRRLAVGDAVGLAVSELGPAGGPAAVVAHGTGSSAEFAARAFGPALLAAGFRLVVYDLRGHGESTPVRDPRLLGVDRHAADLAAVAGLTGARLVGGISLGAHAALAAASASGCGPDGLLLALPAWDLAGTVAASGGDPSGRDRRATAPAAPVLPGVPVVRAAAANAAQVEELERDGLQAALARIRTCHPGWVADELALAWPRHHAASLAAQMRALAEPPSAAAVPLDGLTAPAGVVGLTDDPLHPEQVARQWAAALPRARCTVLSGEEVAGDRARLGAAALSAWRAAGGPVSGPR